jgi:hypothetical protein
MGRGDLNLVNRINEHPDRRLHKKPAGLFVKVGYDIGETK